MSFFKKRENEGFGVIVSDDIDNAISTKEAMEYHDFCKKMKPVKYGYTANDIVRASRSLKLEIKNRGKNDNN